jgi:hypothetical protein
LGADVLVPVITKAKWSNGMFSVRVKSPTRTWSATLVNLGGEGGRGAEPGELGGDLAVGGVGWEFLVEVRDDLVAQLTGLRIRQRGAGRVQPTQVVADQRMFKHGGAHRGSPVFAWSCPRPTSPWSCSSPERSPLPGRNSTPWTVAANSVHSARNAARCLRPSSVMK